MGIEWRSSRSSLPVGAAQEEDEGRRDGSGEGEGIRRLLREGGGVRENERERGISRAREGSA